MANSPKSKRKCVDVDETALAHPLLEMLSAPSDKNDDENSKPIAINEDNDPNYLQPYEIHNLEEDDSEFDDIDESTVESESEDDEIDDDFDEPQRSVFFVSASGRKWMKEPVLTKRINRFNPKEHVGPVGNSANESVLDIFNRLFTIRLKREIVKWTNEQAFYVYGKLNKESDHQRVWAPLTIEELDAYLGVLLYIGAMKNWHRRLSSLWHPIKGHTILRSVMSRTRFQLINCFLRFHDSVGCSANNSLEPVQVLIGELNQSLSDNYNPAEDLIIHKQVKEFRGRCKFRQYSPSDPAKCGLKFWWLYDSATGYPLKVSIESTSVDQSDVVMSLLHKYFNSGHHLTMNNSFVSIDLALKLLDKNITVLGSIRRNNKDVPKPFFADVLHRELYSSLFEFSDKMTLVSYVSKPRKAVIMLSTKHGNDTSTSGAQPTPEMILAYNRAKGVEDLDEMISTFSCSLQTKRWPMLVFYNLLDAVALSTVIISRNSNPPTRTSKLFRYGKLEELAEALMEFEINARSDITRRAAIGKSSVDALRQMGRFQLLSVGRPMEEKVARKAGRCHICPRKEDRKTKTVCGLCARKVCNFHQSVVCVNCSPL